MQAHNIHLVVNEDLEKQREDVFSLALTPLKICEKFADFWQEAYSLPLLGEERTLCLSFDDLTKEEKEKLLHYLQKPSPYIVLVITAKTLPPPSFTKKIPSIKRAEKEKPWEKIPRLAEDLTHLAAARGTCLPLPVANKLASHFEGDRNIVLQELEKLICYSAGKGEITERDLQQVVTPFAQETIWQLSDAMMGGDFPLAYRAMKSLVEKEVNIFSLLASLKTQNETASRILACFEKGGAEEVSATFPYLKGKFLEKKLSLIRRCGKEKIARNRELLFFAEIDARSGLIGPESVIEKLLILAIPYTSSSATVS